ncbi:hypothetical protein DRW07_12920 [Alteromonas sediminis]|uniref:7-cyano-7-deazaguanine synthase n=1 Tax=Alteromonas sediminis TaxID=2259342 RepID=A0A3N5Z5S4_9ALTE|nr:hypothetical protein [Alteromonas sediminis]RPJ65714.1 hypothetical protein DRW07_12920 [Alteromonas sediminis]
MKNILWTGGWDSTFRLLQALFIDNETVQPYYIVDHNRKSTRQEFLAIRKIYLKVKEKIGTSKLLPTKIYYRWELKPNASISESYNSLKSKMHVGTQYEWLALFAEQHQLNDLELSIQSHEHNHQSQLQKLMLENMVDFATENARLKENFNKDLEIYKYYKFPVLHIKKQEMADIAKEHSFDKLMLDTWFCHTPIFEKPCGVCKPCQISKTVDAKVDYSPFGLLKRVF